jgi:rod shape-determining protein MreC
MYNLSAPQKIYLSELARTYLFAIPAWFFTDAAKYVEAAEKRKFLSTQLVKTTLQNMLLYEASLENKRLRAALDFSTESLNLNPIAAFVVSRDQDIIYDNVVINIGTEEGVKIGYCVITPLGLIGHVSSVEKSNSIVTLITRSRISALVSESRTQGIVNWVRGHTFRLSFVDAARNVTIGQTVTTSGLGGRFPKGLPIGKITNVKQDMTSPVFQEVFLESSVDLINLEEVFVLPVTSGSLDF